MLASVRQKQGLTADTPALLAVGKRTELTIKDLALDSRVLPNSFHTACCVLRGTLRLAPSYRAGEGLTNAEGVYI